MNDTKWRELCVAFSNSEAKSAWRTKDFLSGHVSEWDREWYHHIGPDYCTIEWLEIESSNDKKEKAIQILVDLGVPFESGDSLRVFGYRK